MQISDQRVREGLERLLSAPRDLVRWDASTGDPGRQNASAEHSKLYARYRKEFASAARNAENEWDAEIDWLKKNSPNPAAAVRERWTMIPAGPAARPFLVALTRKLWLACDALNRRVPVQQAVSPEVLLIKWPMEECELQDVSLRVLACMPYWPLGLDQQGNWI